MSRGRRHCPPGSLQHIISRFVDRQFHFGDQQDRRVYLKYLGKCAIESDWSFLSFALMSSHVHVGAVPGQDALTRVFHPAHTRFSGYWHRRYGGLGPIFADRPANFEIRRNRIARLIAYHHRNPVTARAVRTPAESQWTSHRYYLRLDAPPPWLQVTHGLALCGFSDDAAGRALFDQFVREVNLDDSDLELFQRYLGPSCEQLPMLSHSKKHRWLQNDPTLWDHLRSLVADQLNEKPDILSDRSHRGTASRRLFALTARVLGQPYSAIAAQLNVNPSAVHHLINRNPNVVQALQPRADLLAARFAEQIAQCREAPKKTGVK